MTRWVLVVGLAPLIVACARKETPRTTARPPEGRPVEQEGWHSRVVSTKEGRPTAVIRYGHMVKYKGDRVYRFDQGVEVDLFNDEGDHLSHVTADSGVMHEASYDVEAHGNVVVVSDSGVVLLTQRLFYTKENDKVYSDAPVTIVRGPGDTLYGKGFESDKNLRNYTFYEPRGVTERKIDLDLERHVRPRRVRADSAVGQSRPPSGGAPE
ncbi:MAG: LPS export ABC transporter periplasmic protein LptC [bacterium]|nr:LPS export ABC transporter periplasmic protein LptC [candidate division KSB1 bacterium]MDH7560275.1 LPS export ABC transporter periplasmic protein LptC [bacterium]